MADPQLKEGALQVGVKDEFLDTTKITQTDGTVVHREAVFLADPVNPQRRMLLTNMTPHLDDDDPKVIWGITVSDPQSISINNALQALYEQNERMLAYLESMAS